MTGSWDKTLRYWDLRSPSPAVAVNLPERVYCADAKNQLAVVGTADRQIYIYSLNNPQQVCVSAPCMVDCHRSSVVVTHVVW